MLRIYMLNNFPGVLDGGSCQNVEANKPKRANRGRMLEDGRRRKAAVLDSTRREIASGGAKWESAENVFVVSRTAEYRRTPKKRKKGRLLS